MTWTVTVTVMQTATGLFSRMVGSYRHSKIAKRHCSASAGQGAFESAGLASATLVTSPEAPMVTSKIKTSACVAVPRIFADRFGVRSRILRGAAGNLPTGTQS